MSLRERARDKPGQEWLTMTSQERPAGRGQRKDDVLRELRADGALTAAELVERTSLSRPPSFRCCVSWRRMDGFPVK